MRKQAASGQAQEETHTHTGAHTVPHTCMHRCIHASGSTCREFVKCAVIVVVFGSFAASAFAFDSCVPTVPGWVVYVYEYI